MKTHQFRIAAGVILASILILSHQTYTLFERTTQQNAIIKDIQITLNTYSAHLNSHSSASISTPTKNLQTHISKLKKHSRDFALIKGVNNTNLQQLDTLAKQLNETDTGKNLATIQRSIALTLQDLNHQHTHNEITNRRLILAFMIIGPILIIGLGITLFLPISVQHQSSLAKVQKTNNRLTLKTQELTTTQLTLNNMLNDMKAEKKQIQKTEEINARLAAVINSSDDAIVSLNLSAVVVTANPASKDLYGEYIVGMRFPGLFPKEAADNISNIIRAIEEQHSGTTIEVNLITQGVRKSLALTLSPIYFSDDRLIGYSVIAKDMSDAKLEEEQLRVAAEAAPNAMLMINQHGYIVLVNSQMEKMFGYTRDELFGESVHTLLPPNLRHTHSKLTRDYFRNPTQRAMGIGIQELKGQRKNGQKFPIEVGLTPVQIQEQTYVISSIIDVSDRLEQQRELKELNTELKRANLEMEQFIYAVSHDLKAPLVTISGFAERLLLDESIVDTNRHKLERIVSNVKSMDSLLQDLLHLSRVIKKDLEKKWIDTEVIVNNTIESLEINIKKSGGEIHIIKPLPHIFAQESLLYQCVQNIISNSIKYRQKDINPIITITPVIEKTYTGLSIADNGMGIAEKYHKKIFHVFERLQPDSCEGTGVGLAIVKTIIEKHQGKISIDSEEGKGCRLTILFPTPKENVHHEQKSA